MESLERIQSREVEIGWIGTGVMGLAMCSRLIDSGFLCSVYNRTPSKAKPLLDRGAIFRTSPLDVARHADILITMVGFPDDVRDVYLRKGVLEHAPASSILIDMTTTKPSLAQELSMNAQQKGLSFIDAPVSGGDVGARNGTLSIMVGGPEDVVNAVMPIFKVLGKNIVYQGGAGAGQHTKMCNQVVIASTMIGVCESLVYGYKAGLDLPTVLRSIGSGAAGCWTLDHLAPRILDRNFEPGFFVAHFVKDMGIALDEARRMGLTLPGLSLAHELYQKTVEMGHAHSGTHALIHAIESLVD